MKNKKKPPRLRRCPFCGEKAEIIKPNGETVVYEIQCGDFACGAMIIMGNQEYAVKSWNKRRKAVACVVDVNTNFVKG